MGGGGRSLGAGAGGYGVDLFFCGIRFCGSDAKTPKHLLRRFRLHGMDA